MSRLRRVGVSLAVLGVVALLVLAIIVVAHKVADGFGARGMALQAGLRYDEALEQYARALGLDPFNWRWKYYQALIHIERGDAHAADALRAATRANPDLAIAWWRLAEIEFKEGRHEAAAESYARAASDPALAPYVQRGRARLAGTPMAGQVYKPPRDPMLDALADISTNPVFLIRQASTIDITRDPRRREQLVRRAVETNPRDPDVVYEMGSLLQQLRRPQEALGYFTRHLDMVDDDQQTLVQIGKCYTDMNRLDDAEAALRRALALGDDAVGSYNLGVVLEERGQDADAEREYRRAVDLGPGLASARNNLGGLFARTGRSAEAKHLLDESIRLDPTSPDAYTNMSALLLNEGAFGEAARYARLALEANPRHADAHVNLGVALAQTGDLDGARRELEEALKINPRHEGASKNLEAIRQLR
jgi:tetratricopeptide (TPR) repeat protein